MNFVWDAKKDAANRKKHHIAFDEAATVFQDPLALYLPDDTDADRGIVIGTSTAQRKLYVVHIEVSPDRVIRIISARKATRPEVKRYEARS